MPVIYLIGDSTVEDNQPPFRGWGWALPGYVRENVEVKNHALSGRSSKSFRQEGLFAPVEEALREGDLLLIQFGHNDEKTDERHSDPETEYPENLYSYCRAALDRGARPVLFTPVSRRLYDENGALRWTHGAYPEAVRRLAREKGLPLCDLEADSRRLYLALGREKTAELFVRLAPGENPDFPDGHDDPTHFNAYGAEEICRLAVEEMRAYLVCEALLKKA